MRRVVVIVVLILVTISTLVFWSNYKFDRCVTINKEEPNRCLAGDLGEYDCTVFENAEELCALVP